MSLSLALSRSRSLSLYVIYIYIYRSLSLSLALSRFLYTSYIGDLQKTRFSLEMCREDTFYPERPHSIPRKHILYQANTFHPRGHILFLEHTFYS